MVSHDGDADIVFFFEFIDFWLYFKIDQISFILLVIIYTATIARIAFYPT